MTTRHTMPIRRMTTVAAALLLGASLGLGASGCGIQTEELGNVIADCPAGTSCSCGTGNCVMGCTGGGCDLTCTGASNCTFDCEGGGCAVACANTGNCFVACAGGGCDVTCTNLGNCGITECDATCSLTCANTGNCF